VSHERDAIIALRARRETDAARETGPRFMGIPDRWYGPPGPLFRCTSGHVSRAVLKSTEHGDVCLACGSSCLMTFPEDVDDPGSS
jgi:hypothetical protein